VVHLAVKIEVESCYKVQTDSSSRFLAFRAYATTMMPVCLSIKL